VRHLNRQEAIYDRWFGSVAAAGFSKEAVFGSMPKWFGLGMTKEEALAFDLSLREEFKEDFERLEKGEYDDWRHSSAGVTSLCILGDQFSRNAFRGTAKAFSFDAKVLEIVLEGIANKLDEDLPYIVRSFWYMPLEHAEDITMSKQMLDFFESQSQTLTGWEKEMAKQHLNYGKKHSVVIEKFGRYPYRNAVLGRTSTEEEIEYLKTAETFGQ